MTSSPPTSRLTWLRLGLLAFATFVYVTFEIFPVGVISDISTDLGVTEGRIGLLVSGYAVVAGLATIPSVHLAARFSRKQALVVSLVALVAAEVLTSVAGGYPTMVTSRVLAALTHGILWSLVAPMAATLVPRDQVGMATSVVFSGATAAAVAGSPLSTLVGDLVGWRVAAAGLAVLTAATAVGLVLTLPSTARETPDPQADEGAGAGGAPKPDRVALRTIFALAVVVVFAHFVSYTYFALLVQRVFGGNGLVAGYLSLFGVAGAGATYLVGRYSDADPVRSTVTSVAVLVLGTGGVAVSLGSVAAGAPVVVAGVLLTVAVLAWGAGYAAIGPNYQAGVMRAAGDHVDGASSVYVTCYQAGIASGSAVGALLVGPALGWLPVLSVLAAAVALLATLRCRSAYAPVPRRGGVDAVAR